MAALDEDPRVRTALVREVGRGLGLFRGAVIETLGNRRAAYAVDARAAVAALDRPLQDAAALALGRIGGERAVKVLSGVKASGTDAQMTVRAAVCLAQGNCDELRDEVVRELTGSGPKSLSALGTTLLVALAERGDLKALASIVDGATAAAEARRRLGVAFASIAVRQPSSAIGWLGANPGREAAIVLLHEGFDMLEEDLAEEGFYSAARASYWQAPEGSGLRTVTAALIDKLEF